MISREAVCVRRQGDRDPRRPASERALRRHADGGAEAPAGPRDQAVDATAPQGAARQPKQARRKRRRPGGVVAIPQPGSWPRDLEGLRRGERIQAGLRRAGEIGSASCRARVCKYVSISVVAVSLKKKGKIENETLYI